MRPGPGQPDAACLACLLARLAGLSVARLPGRYSTLNSSNTNRPAGPAAAGRKAGGAEPAEDERAAVATVLPMIWGVHISRAVYVAAELGVADLLAGGPMTAAQLAQATRVHEPSLYRVLRLLAALGVLTEQDGRLLALTVLGERLRAEVPASVRSWALLVESLETALGFEPLTELCRQVIEACVPERDLGAESCDDRRLRQAIGRTMLPAPRYLALFSL